MLPHTADRLCYNSSIVKWFLKILRKILKCAAVAVALLVALVVLVLVIETPDAKRFKRYCDYPKMDALLAAETNDVVRFDDCTINGTNVTIVSMRPCRWIASGCAMLVYDADGKLIDKTRDEGDDGRFQRTWSEAWRKSLNEKTCRESHNCNSK